MQVTEANALPNYILTHKNQDNKIKNLGKLINADTNFINTEPQILNTTPLSQEKESGSK